MPEQSHSTESRSAAPEAQRKGRGASGKLIALGFTAVALVLLFRTFDAKARMQAALDWIEGLGYWGPVVFILVYIAATVALLPGSILTLGAGALFGLPKGFIWVSLGSVLGATAAFIVGRYVARDWAAQRIAGNTTFAAVDEAIAEEGWKIVGLLRLSPMFPFNSLNYGCALTRISLRDYFLASWIGMIPGTIMWVYIGYLANVAAADEANSTKALKIGGFIATLVFTIAATRIAKKALDRKLANASATGS